MQESAQIEQERIHTTGHRSVKGGQRIIEENIQILYKLPERKYRCINTLLTGHVRAVLLSILNYIKDKKIIISKNRYVFFLDNNRITYRLRKKSTTAVSSRTVSFLCGMGLLNKISQTDDDMLGINREFMLETGAARPINVFSCYRYTEKELDRIEKRCQQLISAKVTAGNISFKRLNAVDLSQMAKEVYPGNRIEAYFKAQKDYEEVNIALESLCQEHGYATKQDLYNKCKLAQKEINCVLRIFKQRILDDFEYRPPKKDEKLLYNLSGKWIFTMRKEDNIE